MPGSVFRCKDREWLLTWCLAVTFPETIGVGRKRSVKDCLVDGAAIFELSSVKSKKKKANAVFEFV